MANKVDKLEKAQVSKKPKAEPGKKVVAKKVTSVSAGRGRRFGGPRHTLRHLASIFKPSIGVLGNAQDLQNFVKILTDANAEEIQKYTYEIMLKKDFHDQLKENRRNFKGRPFLSWFPSIGSMLGTMLYTLCRNLNPDTVVETGVASGVSSTYILCALEENRHGKLYSIDLTWEKQSGWIIPDCLKRRWQLVIGRSSEKLPPFLEKLGAIDIFLHDSDHSYQNMLWEYQTAWVYLKDGGILLSHNVDDNDAFPDFCETVGVEGFLLTNMGGIVKI